MRPRDKLRLEVGGLRPLKSSRAKARATAASASPTSSPMPRATPAPLAPGSFWTRNAASRPAIDYVFTCFDCYADGVRDPLEAALVRKAIKSVREAFAIGESKVVTQEVMTFREHANSSELTSVPGPMVESTAGSPTAASRLHTRGKYKGCPR